jgi:hypothetical protein
MAGIYPDYSKRDCSLPPGCKDLIDVLRLQSDRKAARQRFDFGRPVTVRSLAALLGCKPMEIIADLMELRIMATVDQAVTFEVAARVAAKYGFLTKRA